MNEKYYKTPNGSIVSLSVLKEKYKDKINDVLSQSEEVVENVYKTPNNSIVLESVLKNKYKDRFNDVVSQSVLLKKKEQSIPASTPTSIASKEVPKPLQEIGTTTNSQVAAVDNYIANADNKLPTDSNFMANIGGALSNEKINQPRTDLVEVSQEQKDLEEVEKRNKINKDKQRVYTALDYIASDKAASRKKLYAMNDDEIQSIKDDLIDRLKLSPDAIDEAIAERKQQFKKERDVLIVNDAKKKTKEDLINKAINKSVDLEKYEPQIFRRDAKPDITQPLGFTPKKTTILSKLNEEDKKKVIQEAEKEYNANIDIKAYSLLSEDDKNIAKNNAEFQSVSEQLKDVLSNKDGIDEKKSIELKEKLVELEMQRKELGARERLYNPFTGQTIDRDKATPEIVEFNNTVQQMKKSLTDKDITKKVLEDNLIKLEYFQNKLDEKIPNYQNITYRDLLNPATTMKYQFIDEATEKEAFKLRDEFLDAGAKAQALSSAIYTNQDPAAIKRGLFKESGGSDAFGRGLSDAIGLRNRLTDLDEAEIATKFTEAMQEAEENNVLTKAQIENAKETFGEKLTYGAGASLPVMAEIMASNMLLESGAGALGVARGLVKMRGLIETIVKSKKASNLFTNIIKEGAKGVITFAPTSETGLTGSVEGVTQALLPQNMFKGNKYGKLMELGTRILAGTATETPAELAGMYVQSASDNGWDMEAAFDRTFGRTPKEIWETLAMTTATSAMMSGAFNSPILLTSKKGLEQEVAKGNVPKEDLEAVQEIITLADEKLSSDNPKVVTIKSEGKESIVPTEDFEATLQDEAFIEKVANGDIDVSIDNDTELGNRLNEKVEAFKTEQEITKAFEDDSENEAGLQSDEQVETPKVEAGSVGVEEDVRMNDVDVKRMKELEGMISPEMFYSEKGQKQLIEINKEIKAIESKYGKHDLILEHGTPHDFDKFQLDKIGTGEGQQAFGYGLYFTENSKIAKTYAEKLSKDKEGIVYQVSIKNGKLNDWLEWRDALDDTQAENISNVIKNKKTEYDKYLSETKKDESHTGAAEELFNDNISVDERPLQAGAVYADLRDAFGSQEATRIMQEAGIDGVKYKTKGGKGNDFNYVVFNHESIIIKNKQSLKEQPKAETTKTDIDETESTGTTETTEDDTKSNTRLDDAPTGKEEYIPEIERKEKQTGIRTSRLPITDIEVRPDVFQFKAVDEESGVNKAEKLEGSYDENLAGTIGVWVDTKGEVGDVGKTYVVDGHHRMEFAKRNNIDEMNVFYIDAPTANDAKVIAAKANIAQGRGTAIDAAKVFKASPESETKSFIPKSKVGRDGLALSNLSEPLFNLVVNGKLGIDRGVLLSQGKDATVQEAVYNEIKKVEGSGAIKMKNSTIKEYIDAGNSSNKTTETTVDLFGETEQEKVDISTRMNLLGTIRDKLISAKNIFGQAARNSDVLNKVGNKVNEEMNAGLSKDAAENIALFDAFKNTTILSKTINDAVDKYKEAKTRKEKTDITEKLYNDIISIVTKEVGRKDSNAYAELAALGTTDKKADIERRRKEELLGKSFTETTEKVVTGKGQSAGKTIVRFTESKISSDGEVLTIKPKAKFKNEDTSLSTTPETITVKEFREQFYENLSEQDKEMFDEFFTDDSTRMKLVEARIGLKGNSKGQVNIDVESLEGQPFGFELQNGKEINAKYDAEYVDAVKNGEMTREQAMQALEEVGKESTTESKTAAEETKRERIDREIKETVNKMKGKLGSGGLQNIEEFVKLVSLYVEKGILNVQELIDRIRKDFPNEPFNTKMVDDALAIINANKNLTIEVAKGNKVSDGLKTVFNDYQTNGGTLSYNEFLKGLKSYISEQKKIKEQAKVEERKAETETILESKLKTKEDKIKKVALKLGLKTQQDLNKEVADLIKEHMVKGLLNDRQVKALTKRALGVKVGNLKSQTDFANFFNKVMDDVEYINKHTEAQSIISKAKKQAKSKTAFENTENLANKIASIDINYIENIDGLLDVLREYNDDKKVPNVAKLTNDINPFVEESMLGKEEALRQKTFEIAEGLGYGKAALNGLTYAEIKKLLETPTGLEETLSSEEKLQEKKAAMVEANSILRDFLKGLDTTELSAKEKGLLKDLINVDLSELNLGELKSLFLVGNNILTNQSFANAENLAITFKSKHDAKVFLKQVKNSKIMLSKAWLNPFRSFQQLIDNIFMKNRVLAAKFTDLIGELNANEGRKIVKDKTDIFIERFNKILNDNKLNTLADRARITAAALGLRYDGYHNMTEEEEFQGNKADINANYENTKNDADFKDELQEAKEAADFINQFKTKKDLEDFLNKKENKGMKDALTFIEKSFAKIAQERVDLSSTMFNSGMKLVDKHYAPKKVITRDKNDADSVNPFEQKYTQISLTPKRAGSAIDANKPGSLGNNRLGLDLLVYGSYEMEKALTEIHLSKATLKAKTILKSKDVQDVLGISTTRLLEEKIKNQYAPQIERSQSSAKLNSVIDFIRKSTTASILSGFSQLIKQSSVIANISSTLPPKQALLFSKELATGLKNFKVATLITPTITKQLVNPIHKMFAIGSRVEMNIGVDRGETARKARKNLLGKQSGFIRMTGKYLGKGHDVITDLLLSPMHVQDIYISTATWNAAYKGYLAENGITDVDMATEHEKIVGDNNEAQIRREAAAYAEHMVGITQIPSDAAQRAEIMKDGNMSSKLLRIITTPFNNFGINSLVRKVDAVKGLFNKEGKVQSAKDLVGLVAEAAAFQYTKYALAIHVFPKLASITYAALTGEDEDDVDELVKVDKEYAEKVIDRSLDALYVDLVLQGTPEAAKELTVSLLNAINYNFKKENGLIDDSISFSDWQKEGGGLSQFKKDDDYLIQSYGLLGIMPTKLSNSYTSTKLIREGIVEGFMGKDKKVKLADKDKRVMQVIEVIEYLNAMGLSGADLSNISSKIKKGILDKHKGKKGAKKKVIKPIS